VEHVVHPRQRERRGGADGGAELDQVGDLERGAAHAAELQAGEEAVVDDVEAAVRLAALDGEAERMAALDAGAEGAVVLDRVALEGVVAGAEQRHAEGAGELVPTAL